MIKKNLVCFLIVIFIFSFANVYASEYIGASVDLITEGAMVTLETYNLEPTSGVVFLVKYNGEKLEWASYSDFYIEAGQTSCIVKFEFEKSEGVYKFFVWDKDFSPLCKNVSITVEPIIKYYVSSNGSDINDGSQQYPFATISHAKEQVRKIIEKGMKSDIEIIISGGVYTQGETLVFSQNDSGNNGFKVTYKGVEDEYPVISGGVKVTGFEKLPNGMWKTTVPEVDVMMELYVNDVRVYRAAMDKDVYGLGTYNDPETAYETDGIYISKNILDDIEYPQDLVLRGAKSWKGFCVPVTDMIPDITDNNRNIIILNDYYQIIQTGSQWIPSFNPYYGFKIENAFEFLDSPGEYYFNKRTHELYYMPKDGECIETAQVYAPKLEHVIKVKGDNGFMASDIVFEKIKFAHCSYLTPDESGYTHGQATENFVFNSVDQMNTPAGVEVFVSKNILFENCVIYGMGGVGITLGYSTKDCSIKGCAIYDTGESGVILGWSNLKYLDSERVDMTTRAKWTYSDVGPYLPYAMFEAEGNRWKPINDVNKGQKSFMKFEFDFPVTIDEIQFSTGDFDGKEVRKNFEIVASNDENFETYHVLYNQGDSSYEGNVIRCFPKTTQKYKYLMVRKTKIEPFAIDIIKAYTKDFVQDPIFQAENLHLEDSYITRTGNYYYGAIGVCVYAVNGAEILNNEIYKTPYSGISVGWMENAVCNPGIKVNNNYIHDIMYKCHDGGGIYTLSNNIGGEIKGNHIVNQINNNGAIYNDINSAGWSIKDNIAEYVPNSFWCGLEGERNITISDTYSTTRNTLIYDSENNSDTVYELPEIIIQNNLPAYAKYIVDNAGISDDNIWIKNLVPNSKAYYEDDRIGKYTAYWAYNAEFDTETEVILNRADTSDGSAMTNFAMQYVDSAMQLLNADFGYLPGQYSPNAKLELIDAINMLGIISGVEDTQKIGQTKRYMIFEDAYNKCINLLNRYSLAETINIVQNLLHNTGVGEGSGMCTQLDKDALNKKIEEVKHNEGGYTEYELVKILEEAISVFCTSLHETNINAFKFSGIDGETVIDDNNREITVNIADDIDLTEACGLFELSHGAKLLSQPQSRNIANTSTKIITSGITYGGNLNNLTDGNAENTWISDTGFTVLVLDLGQEYKVDEICINVLPKSKVPVEISGGYEGHYMLGLSNSCTTDYETREEMGWTTGWMTNQLAGKKCHIVDDESAYRYVKVISMTPSPLAFSEIEVLSKDSLCDFMIADFTQPVQISVENGGKCSNWTIKTVKNYISPSPEKRWYNSMNNKPIINNDGITLVPSESPYMYNAAKKTDMHFTMSFNKMDNIWGCKVLFDCPRAQIIQDGYSAQYSHYELTFYKNYIELAYMNNGEKRIIFKENYETNCNENDIHIRTTQSGSAKNVNIVINNYTLFNGVLSSETDAEGGYFGIDTRVATVNIKQFGQ